ncbi:hypothetical protein ACVI1K_001164 [Bradyrhizobium sp. USDA 4508]
MVSKRPFVRRNPLAEGLYHYRASAQSKVNSNHLDRLVRAVDGLKIEPPVTPKRDPAPRMYGRY